MAEVQSSCTVSMVHVDVLIFRYKKDPFPSTEEGIETLGVSIELYHLCLNIRLVMASSHHPRSLLPPAPSINGPLLCLLTSFVA